MPTNDMAAIEERFQAAVNVIKGLPKNGPYQPSTSMMLQFYGLFKQATEGACEQKKPGFWDIVGRAKWDAWISNRHLSKEQAMQRYVESLKEIIETMSFTENVQNFVGSLSGLENINLDELELISPGMRELAESHPSSPFNSRTNSPQHGTSANTTPNTEELSPEQLTQLTTTAASKSLANQNGHLTNGHLTNGYADQGRMTGNRITNDALTNYNSSNSVTAAAAAVDPSDDEYDDPYDLNHDLTVAVTQNSELMQQIQAAVTRMNADMNAVSQRMSNLERTLQEVRSAQQALRGGGAAGKAAVASRRYPVWWPFAGISPSWFLLLVLWPFVVKRFARMLDTNTRRRR